MSERMTDIWDVVLTVVVAVVCMFTGVSAAVDNNIEVRGYVSSYREKNTTAKYTPSEKVYGTYDGSLTREECVLMTQVQDYEMYGPHALSYGDGRVVLAPGNDLYLAGARSSLWKLLSGDDGASGYRVSYDHVTDSYRLSKTKGEGTF